MAQRPALSSANPVSRGLRGDHPDPAGARSAGLGQRQGEPAAALGDVDGGPARPGLGLRPVPAVRRASRRTPRPRPDRAATARSPPSTERLQLRDRRRVGSRPRQPHRFSAAGTPDEPGLGSAGGVVAARAALGAAAGASAGPAARRRGRRIAAAGQQQPGEQQPGQEEPGEQRRGARWPYRERRRPGVFGCGRWGSAAGGTGRCGAPDTVGPGRRRTARRGPARPGDTSSGRPAGPRSPKVRTVGETGHRTATLHEATSRGDP